MRIFYIVVVLLLAVALGVSLYEVSEVSKIKQGVQELSSDLATESDDLNAAITSGDEALGKQIESLKKRVTVLEGKIEKIPQKTDEQPAVKVTLGQILGDLSAIEEKFGQNVRVEFSEIEKVLAEIRGTWPTLTRAQKDELAEEAFALFAGTKVLDQFSGSQSDKVWAVLGEFEEF